MTLALGTGPESQPMSSSIARTSGRLVGIEEELLLVDAETFLPVPVAGDLLRNGPVTLACGSLAESEVKTEQIEIVTLPLSTIDAVFDAVVAGRRAADTLAQTVGARAIAVATPADPCEPHLATSERYERMRERFGLTMDEQLTCGLHVHVTIDSAHEGVAVLDRIRPWLPVLLALSANSPFWKGVDSQYASYRYQAWSRWPTAGAYDRFHTADGYRAIIDDILATEVSLDTGMIYFDARLSSHAPTVEIRIADVCFAPQDAACLGVLIRALVETSVHEWNAAVPAPDVPTPLLRMASWRASRWGLTERLISPTSGRPVPAGVAVDELLAHVAGHFASLEEAVAVRRGIRAILARGNGATQQRRARDGGSGTAPVVRESLEWTYGDRGLGR